MIDLFKEIPLSVVLREQLRTVRDEIARLNAALSACEADRVALAKQRYAARAAGDYDPLERF